MSLLCTKGCGRGLKSKAAQTRHSNACKFVATPEELEALEGVVNQPEATESTVKESPVEAGEKLVIAGLEDLIPIKILAREERKSLSGAHLGLNDNKKTLETYDQVGLLVSVVKRAHPELALAKRGIQQQVGSILIEDLAQFHKIVLPEAFVSYKEAIFSKASISSTVQSKVEARMNQARDNARKAGLSEAQIEQILGKA